MFSGGSLRVRDNQVYCSAYAPGGPFDIPIMPFDEVNEVTGIVWVSRDSSMARQSFSKDIFDVVGGYGSPYDSLWIIHILVALLAHRFGLCPHKSAQHLLDVARHTSAGSSP